MKNIKILRVSNTELTDFRGFNDFPNLVELHAGFNSINNIQGLYFHEKLEVLDLEGNEIKNFYNIDILESLCSLNSLNLTNNPIAEDEEFL